MFETVIMILIGLCAACFVAVKTLKTLKSSKCGSCCCDGKNQKCQSNNIIGH